MLPVYHGRPTALSPTGDNQCRVPSDWRRGSSRRGEHTAGAGACAAAESLTQRGRRPGGDDRRGRRGTTRSAGSGGGVHPAIILTHSRALVPGGTPGNRRRNSTMADSSPSSVNTRRMAAASASSTANMRRTMAARRPAAQAPCADGFGLEESTAPIARPKSRGVPWMPFVKLYRHSAVTTTGEAKAGPAAPVRD